MKPKTPQFQKVRDDLYEEELDAQERARQRPGGGRKKFEMNPGFMSLETQEEMDRETQEDLRKLKEEYFKGVRGDPMAVGDPKSPWGKNQVNPYEEREPTADELEEIEKALETADLGISEKELREIERAEYGEDVELPEDLYEEPDTIPVPVKQKTPQKVKIKEPVYQPGPKVVTPVPEEPYQQPEPVFGPGKKLTVSKAEWFHIGRQAGWFRYASTIGNLQKAVRHVCNPCAERMKVSLEGNLKVKNFKGEIKKDVPDAHVVIPRGPVVLSPEAIKLPGLKSSDDIGFRIEDDGRIIPIIPENETHGVGRMVEQILRIAKELDDEEKSLKIQIQEPFYQPPMTDPAESQEPYQQPSSMFGNESKIGI